MYMICVTNVSKGRFNVGSKGKYKDELANNKTKCWILSLDLELGMEILRLCGMNLRIFWAWMISRGFLFMIVDRID